MIRGAYHFALPNASNGATQAGYFASNGGAWSRDNLTLPGVLDIEHNPYGAMCYGLSTTQMRTWINDFYTTYKSRTGRDVVIYDGELVEHLHRQLDRHVGQEPAVGGALDVRLVAHPPAGFPTWTVWQYTDAGSVSGVSGGVDRNKFNGSRDRLLALANNT